ncbi:hypothetical protein ACFFGT_10590 [Mucilaginibacter angelicae]|uniref:DUF4099 domain-containing protein n=1 Tax=Mucilaginibacter angelicae TaxID=869718 RepID=A0ABV6L5A2_9SPHI
MKQPVIHRINETGYEVDIGKQVLRQTNRQANEISFIRDMQDRGTHYRLIYDTLLDIASFREPDGQRYRLVEVPQMTELHPEGMAARYGGTAEQLKGKSDFEVIVDQQALGLRRSGVLPQIDIAGEPFTVDLRLHELRHGRDFAPVISLLSFTITDDGNAFEAYYQPLLKQTVEIDPGLTELPDHIIRIRLPNEPGLDPVGTAWIYGMDERELLRRHPIQKDLKAELIPLAETNVPTLIRQNREKLQQDHQENARKIRPRQRMHF